MMPSDRGNSPAEPGSIPSLAFREARRIEAAALDLDSFPEPIVRPKFQASEDLLRTYLKEELYVSL